MVSAVSSKMSPAREKSNSFQNSKFSQNAMRIIILVVCLAAVHAFPEHQDEDEGKDACNFSDYLIYCFCDPENSDDGAEDVKCSVSTKDLAPEDWRWTSVGKLRNVFAMEFTNRPSHTLEYLPPARVYSQMKKLLYLTITLSDLAIIPSFGFANSSTLTDLTLTDNRIFSLSRSAFSNLRNLTKLNIGDNLIQEVDRGIFVHLPRLRQLYLDRNHIRVVHDHAFSALSSLEELELHNNNLTVITKDVFFGLKRLKRLDLRMNLIEFLGEYTFAEMPALQELDLMRNQIVSLSPLAFAELKELRTLILKENKVLTLYPQSFRQLSMLHLLDLRNNELETLLATWFAPISYNLKNSTMQLMIEGNHLVCDCRILWIQTLFNESSSFSVKEHLKNAKCDPSPKSKNAQQSSEEGKDSLSLSYNHNPDTTTYAYGNDPQDIVGLSAADLNCPEEQDKESPRDAESQDESMSQDRNDRMKEDDLSDMDYPHNYGQKGKSVSIPAAATAGATENALRPVVLSDSRQSHQLQGAKSSPSNIGRSELSTTSGATTTTGIQSTSSAFIWTSLFALVCKLLGHYSSSS